MVFTTRINGGPPVQVRSEFSKRPPSESEVLQRLQATGASVRLVPGNTRVTLPESRELLSDADFVFIDGGHSIETIRSDLAAVLSAVRPGTPVILDDYYIDPGPELESLGCQSVLAALDQSRYAVSLLEPVDVIQRPLGPLSIRMALVRPTAP